MRKETMHKLVNWFLILVVTLAAAVFVAPESASAQEDPFTQFCLGQISIPGDTPAKPAIDPCGGVDGAFVYVDDSIVMFADYDAFLTHSGTAEGQYMFVAGLMTTADPNDPPSGDPSVWTENVCKGASAFVYQSREEAGDGVTLSIEDPYGCSEPMTTFVVEPWGSVENPDTGCLAANYEEAREFALRLGWLNGSGWLRYEDVQDEFLYDHPWIVQCNDVTGQEDLGLNVYEDQIRPNRIPWMRARAAELLAAADLTWETFCTDQQYWDNPDFKLVPFLCDLEGFAVELPEREVVEEPAG